MLFGLFLAIFFVAFRMISKYRYATMNELQNRQNDLETRHHSLREQKRLLDRELVNKEQALATLRSTQGDIRGITVADLEAAEANENEKIGRYLLNQGKITREQHERALKKMEILKMDYIGVCMALGFIDLETGRQAEKAGKLSTSL
jgi:predicted nuclease with TOPRIM domain